MGNPSNADGGQTAAGLPGCQRQRRGPALCMHGIPLRLPHADRGPHRPSRLAARLAETRAQAAYGAIVVGGGGHGLATAFHLASIHGIARVAVLEKGPIGLGNTGRNTTIPRSNDRLPENHHSHEPSLKLREGLSNRSAAM